MAVTVYDASGNLTSISKILKDNYEKPFLKALDQDTFAFKFFPRKSIDEAFIRWKVHYEGNTGVEWYDEDDNFGAAGKQSYENASSPIRMVRINVEFSGLAEAATRGAGSYINVKTDELEGAMEDLRDAINDRMIEAAADGTGKKIDNLYNIVDNTGTYAGINRGTTSWFQAVKLAGTPAGTPRPLAVGLLQQMHAELLKPRRKARPTAILTSQTHVDQYGDLADARRRFQGNHIDVDLGVDTASYKGITMFATPNMADGRMYFIDKRSWGTHMLVPFETDEVPATKDASIFAIKSYLQLVCKAPYQQGVIVDLAS